MNMTTRMVQMTACVAILTAGSLFLQAADSPNTPPPGRPGFGGGPGGPGGRGGNFLGLDDKQRELLRDAMMKDQEQIRALDEKLRAAQKELVHTALSEKYDEKAVREKAEAVSKIQTDYTVLRAKAFAALAPTLKPEQREQLENSPMGAAMLGGRLGGGMGGGPGFGGRGGNGGPAAPAPGEGQGGRRRPAPAGQ